MDHSAANSNEARRSWHAPPESLLLRDEEVHVWFARLDDSPQRATRLREQLSLEERDRILRFKFEKDRVRYTASHIFMRTILSFYVGIDPKDLRLISGPNGKPELDLIPQDQLVRFNMSHSHEVALLAVARAREIGIDVEYIQENFPFDEIAQRIFSSGEIAALQSLPKHLQREAFFSTWTCKEAYAKAKGTGLASTLDEFEISVAGENMLSLQGKDPNWSLTTLRPIAGYAAALAVEGLDYLLKCWQWQGQKTEISNPPLNRLHPRS